MIYICGDLHADIPEQEIRFLRVLTKDDILIVLGDFGFSWDLKTEKDWKMYHFPFMTLSVLGNHENYDSVYNYHQEEIFGGLGYKMCDNTYYLRNGDMYTINGKKFFCFGGASSIDKEWRTPRASWWKEEVPSEAEYFHAVETLEKNNYTFDYFITHTCGHKEEIDLLKYNQFFKDQTVDMISMLEDMIDTNGSYTHHFFGHHHTFVSNDKHTGMYKQIYCLDTNKYEVT